MTRLLVSTLCFLFCIEIAAQPAPESPVDHMNFLGQLDKNLSMNYLSYMSEVAHGRRARKMEKRRMELINSINEAIREATKMRPFKSDAALRDAFKQYWTVLLTVFKEDYHKIVDMEEVAEQSYDAMEAYLLIKEKASEKLQEACSKIPVAYEAFASRHNVLLTEGQKTKLSERLAQAGKVNHYVNQIYLLFFKSNFQEEMMFKAMEKNDVNGVEQSRNSLTKFSSEGLSKLDTIKPFDGDASLVTACRKVLAFQKSEGEEKGSYMTEFLMKREDFEKTKKSFDAKSSNSRTQADISAYNKAIEDYNKAINTYNKTNTKLNASRTKIMESWEAAQKKFMDVHVPRKL
jgi:tetratricopeptide (TPR) repeat protein